MEEQIKLFKVRMETSNPSADRQGLFRTKEDAEKTIEKWKEIVREDSLNEGDIQYYGNVEFEIEETVILIGTLE